MGMRAPIIFAFQNRVSEAKASVSVPDSIPIECARLCLPELSRSTAPIDPFNVH